MRFLFILALLTKALNVLSQADLRQVPFSSLPEKIQEIQNASMAFRWTDSLGDNVLVISKKMIVQNETGNSLKKEKLRLNKKQSNAVSKKLIPSAAYHYRLGADSITLSWKDGGISATCNGEAVHYAENWTVFTDLDADARAEVWLIYKSACGNQENRNMKIIMYEGSMRYTISGTSSTSLSAGNYLDSIFPEGPEAYKKYAMKLWDEFIKK